jgi:RIO kinase 1
MAKGSNARPAPGWVISENFVDEELGVLKAGKEAGCFLVRRRSEDRYCLLVRKDYRKRSDRTYATSVGAGERQIRRETYTSSLVFLETRQQRAVSKGNKSAYGMEILNAAWERREFDTLHRLWSAGARVPYPVEHYGHGFFMQYIGTLRQAAPRLSDVRLSKAEAVGVFDKLVEQLHILARVGVAHCDLSAYNILVQHGCPWIIDVPQAVDLRDHRNGRQLFMRDVEGLCAWFAKRGVDCNPKRLGAELLSEVVA